MIEFFNTMFLLNIKNSFVRWDEMKIFHRLSFKYTKIIGWNSICVLEDLNKLPIDREYMIKKALNSLSSSLPVIIRYWIGLNWVVAIGSGVDLSFTIDDNLQ
jgi:hypothetical protein